MPEDNHTGEKSTSPAYFTAVQIGLFIDKSAFTT